MTARLTIETYSNEQAIVVPIGAVQNTAAGPIVMTLDASTGRSQRVAVTLGSTMQDGVEIKTGLKAGDQILVPR
jgi:hypothetical protein